MAYDEQISLFKDFHRHCAVSGRDIPTTITTTTTTTLTTSTASTNRSQCKALSNHNHNFAYIMIAPHKLTVMMMMEAIVSGTCLATIDLLARMLSR